jgi:hypothetical protein
MEQPEVHHNPIKAVISKGKLLSIPFLKLKGWVESRRDTNHLGRKIHAHGRGSHLFGGSRHVSRSTRYVQQSKAGGKAGG